MTATATAATAPAEPGRSAVPAARPERRGAVISDGSATIPRAAGNRLAPQASPAALAGTRPVSASGAPGCATPVEAGAECAAVAYVEALDGAERKLLLAHIARAYPEVVVAGAELVARHFGDVSQHRRSEPVDCVAAVALGDKTAGHRV